MRVSKAGLLVVLALLAPVLVELRVVFAWLGIEVTVLQTVVLGAVAVVGVLLWAFFPESDDGRSECDFTNEN